MNRAGHELLRVLLLLELCTVGFVFHHGWFSMSSTDAESAQRQINLSVETHKVQADAESRQDSTEARGGQSSEEPKSTVDRIRTTASKACS